MDYQFTLKRFFVLVFLFVICPLVAWIAYAHRTNAPANMYAEKIDNDTFASNNVTIPDDQLDMATPFYQNKAARLLEKSQGRATQSNAEDKYFSGPMKESKEGKEGEKKNEPAETK